MTKIFCNDDQSLFHQFPYLGASFIYDKKSAVEELKKIAKRILPSPTVKWHANKNKKKFEELVFFC